VSGSDAANVESDLRPEAFISHSSRDKNLFVRPLVECLADQGVDVWYDEYSMQPGDSLSASIDRGLAAARYGVVIISPAFIVAHDKPVHAVALKIIEVIAPYKAGGLQRQRLLETWDRTGERIKEDLSKLEAAPAQDRSLAKAG
jgi:hypothetical protein